MRARFALFFLLLAGCSTPEVKVGDASPPGEPIGRYSILHVDVRSTD